MISCNPYSAEMRYTLDLMIYALQAREPRSIRIASHSAEFVKAALRRLACADAAVLVEDQALQVMARDSLGMVVQVAEQGAAPADAALFPFSLNVDASPAREPFIVVACENALSYKSLLHAGRVKGTALGQMNKLKADYRLAPVAGLYAPSFVLRHFTAQLARQVDPAWWFRLEDQAMRRLIERGPFWRLSYIVVFAGRAFS